MSREPPEAFCAPHPIAGLEGIAPGRNGANGHTNASGGGVKLREPGAKNTGFTLFTLSRYAITLNLRLSTLSGCMNASVCKKRQKRFHRETPVFT